MTEVSCLIKLVQPWFGNFTITILNSMKAEKFGNIKIFSQKKLRFDIHVVT